MSRKFPFLTVSLLVGLVIWQYYLGGQPEGRVLIEYGARKANAGFPQSPWRLFASLALHANWLHLLSNAFMIGILGPLLERLLGRLELLATLVLAGLWGNLLSDIYGPEALAMGASGAALGLVTLVIALAAMTRDREEWGGGAKSWLKVCSFVLLLNIVMGVGWGAGQQHRLDHWAHAGGAIYGGLLGVVVGKAQARGRSALWMVSLASSVLAVGLIWWRGASPFG